MSAVSKGLNVKVVVCAAASLMLTVLTSWGFVELTSTARGTVFELVAQPADQGPGRAS